MMLIRVYDEGGNVIDTHEQAGDVKEPRAGRNKKPARGEAQRLIVKCRYWSGRSSRDY
jgi:hypothetical protein